MNQIIYKIVIILLASIIILPIILYQIYEAFDTITNRGFNIYIIDMKDKWRKRKWIVRFFILLILVGNGYHLVTNLTNHASPSFEEEINYNHNNSNKVQRNNIKQLESVKPKEEYKEEWHKCRKCGGTGHMSDPATFTRVPCVMCGASGMVKY